MDSLRRIALLAAVSFLAPVGCGPPLEDEQPLEQEDTSDVISARLAAGSGQVSFHLGANMFRRVPLSGSVYTNHWTTFCTNTGVQFHMNVYRGDGSFVASRYAYYQAEWSGGSNNHFVNVSSGSSARDCTTLWD